MAINLIDQAVAFGVTLPPAPAPAGQACPEPCEGGRQQRRSVYPYGCDE
jgi:hypothetical protein